MTDAVPMIQRKKHACVPNSMNADERGGAAFRVARADARRGVITDRGGTTQEVRQPRRCSVAAAAIIQSLQHLA
jgi:hypothetical protein